VWFIIALAFLYGVSWWASTKGGQNTASNVLKRDSAASGSDVSGKASFIPSALEENDSSIQFLVQCWETAEAFLIGSAFVFLLLAAAYVLYKRVWFWFKK
jgi:hypothetical protein